MSMQSVTIAFSPEAENRTLADCLEQLLRHLDLETPQEDSQ